MKILSDEQNPTQIPSSIIFDSSKNHESVGSQYTTAYSRAGRFTGVLTTKEKEYEVTKDRSTLKFLWRYSTGKCVDASPLLIISEHNSSESVAVIGQCV